MKKTRKKIIEKKEKKKEEINASGKVDRLTEGGKVNPDDMHVQMP